MLTVAVSISSGVDSTRLRAPGFDGHEVHRRRCSVVLLMAVNLRGVRESGTAFAIPTYAFMVGILGMILLGLFPVAFGDLPDVESARSSI